MYTVYVQITYFNKIKVQKLNKIAGGYAHSVLSTIGSVGVNNIR